MKELRKELREIRRSIGQPSRKRYGKHLLHQCQKNAIFRNAKHVAIFIPNDGEIETRAIINFLVHQGYFVYLPILVGEKLKFAKLGKFSRKNRFGIEEPIFTPLLGAHRMILFLCLLLDLIKIKID